MGKQKITKRTCGQCKTVFPVGQGHNARTCGKKINLVSANMAKQIPEERLGATLKKSVQGKTCTQKKRKVVNKERVGTQKHSILPVGIPKSSFEDFVWGGKVGDSRKEVLVKTSSKTPLKPLSKKWLKKYHFISDKTKKVWFNEEGLVHRLDGPAVEYADGRKEWWADGKVHCLNGPAVVLSNGSKEWWVNGKLHRLDGPAVERANGDKVWWVNGKLHRLDGPAVERGNGDKEWWVNNKQHRLDGPAVEWSNGGKVWWVGGKRHRLDGPAVEWSNGGKVWWVGGKRHRIDGPAVEYVDGTKEWWVDGLNMEQHADNPSIPEITGEYFYFLCINKNPTIRKKAISNPNCPTGWKVAERLTQR